MAGGFVYVDNIAAAVPIGLLGLLLLVQVTSRPAYYALCNLFIDKILLIPFLEYYLIK